MSLTFNELRSANIARLPLFKNKKGLPAHSKPDGSDWSPAQWLQAVMGELGEYANFRKKYERGDISKEEFDAEAGKELADVQIYLDILAFQLGVDLGKATISKYNEVSDRINVPLMISKEGKLIRL
jgi:NTP pyrophosphatase (non-canonical NTP hydrolase)